MLDNEQEPGGKERVSKTSMDWFFMITADELANTDPVVVVVVDKRTEERYWAMGKKGVRQEGEMVDQGDVAAAHGVMTSMQ